MTLPVYENTIEMFQPEKKDFQEDLRPLVDVN